MEDYIDLWDFCDLLQESCGDTPAGVNGTCDKIKTLIEPADGSSEGGTAVLKSCVSGADFQHSHGLSIYFPWVDISPVYSHLGFACKQRPLGTACNHKHIPETDSEGKIQTTPWFDFIRQYVEKSRRPLRRWKDKPTGGALIFGHLVSSLPPQFRAHRRVVFGHSTSSASSVRFAGTKDDKFGVDLDPKIKNPPRTFFKDPCIDEKTILDDDSVKPK